MLAACAARRWLARNAAGVARIRSQEQAAASACTSLVCCLPALEQVELRLYGPLVPGDLGSLLEALSWMPRLRALNLHITCSLADVDEDMEPIPDVRAFTKLRSLTKLALAFDEADPCIVPDVADALAPLTGLAELMLTLPGTAVLPAALGRLKGLRSLELRGLRSCGLVAGCLNLPKLTSLAFDTCTFESAKVLLPSVTALRNLVRIVFTGGQAPRLLTPQLIQLPRLQHVVLKQALYVSVVVFRGFPGCQLI